MDSLWHPRANPVKFHIFKRSDGTFNRSEYAGTVDGTPRFCHAGVFVSVADALAKRNPIPSADN